jgi:hypothetical protein
MPVMHKGSESFRRKRDILVALVFGLVPFGFSIPIKYACLCWFVAWVAVLSLMWNGFMADWKRIEKIGFCAFLTVVLCSLVQPSIKAAYSKEMAHVLTGDLVSDDDGRDHSKDYPKLEMGDGPTSWVWTGKPGETMFTALRPNVADKFTIEMVNGRVQFSTTVRDKNENLIVEIRKNHWTISPGSWEHNYTKDRLEVKDGKGRVVLQVRILPDTVQLQEELSEENGVNGGIFEAGHYDVRDGITPVFKYPSELYWGQLQ